jgi:hypothetical protein
MVAALGLSAADVALAAAPFTRMGGLGVTVLPTLFAGGAVAVSPVVDGPVGHGDPSRARSASSSRTHLLGPHGSCARMARRRSVLRAHRRRRRRAVPEPLLRRHLDRGVRLPRLRSDRGGAGVSLLDDDEAAERPGRSEGIAVHRDLLPSGRTGRRAIRARSARGRSAARPWRPATGACAGA